MKKTGQLVKAMGIIIRLELDLAALLPWQQNDILLLMTDGIYVVCQVTSNYSILFKSTWK